MDPPWPVHHRRKRDLLPPNAGQPQTQVVAVRRDLQHGRAACRRDFCEVFTRRDPVEHDDFKSIAEFFLAQKRLASHPGAADRLPHLGV